MGRVKWKLPYVKHILLKKLQNVTLVSKSNIKTVSRNSEILPKFIGLTLRVYNGKAFVTITINDEMIGHKIGEFVSTRKQFSYKKKKKK
jgi:small subunit ribosomal protein S19